MPNVFDQFDEKNPFDQFDEKPVGAASGVMDFLKSIPTGIRKGLSNSVITGTGHSNEAFLTGGAAEMDPSFQGIKVPEPKEIDKALEKNVTGPMHEPQGVAGEYGQTLGQFIPPAFMTPLPGTMLAKSLMGAALPAVGAESAGQVARSGGYDETIPRILGGVAAPGAAGKIAAPFASANNVFENVSGPARNNLVKILQEHGITPSAGQETGNRALRYLEDEAKNQPISAGAATRLEEGIKDKFTEALTKQAGGEGKATGENLYKMSQEIGDKFDVGRKYNFIPYHPELPNKLDNALAEYQSNTSAGNLVPKIQQRYNEIMKYGANQDTPGQPPGIPGAKYADLRSELGKEAHRFYTGKNPDYNAGTALHKMQDALDESFQSAATPQDAATIDQARREWSNYKVLQHASSLSKGQGAEGLITPAAYANALEKHIGESAYVRGTDPRAPLAKAARAILDTPPQSGTAPRLMSHLGAPAIGAAAGAMGLEGHEVAGAVLGLGAGAGADKLLEKLSEVGQGARARFWVSPAGQALARQGYVDPTKGAAYLARAVSEESGKNK